VWLNSDHFLRQHLAQAQLSYEQTEPDWEPAFVLFEWKGNIIQSLIAPKSEVRVAPPDWTPPRVEAEAPSLTSPTALSGPLTFLGYQVLSAPSDKTVEMETAWRVEATPNRPLSIMAHLVGANGVPIAVGDGLGVSVDQWQAGDIIVQRHRLAIPADTLPGIYWLQTGVYWLDTLERWPIQQEGYPAGDRLLLTSVKVK
jgi:hypothetical protein